MREQDGQDPKDGHVWCDLTEGECTAVQIPRGRNSEGNAGPRGPRSFQVWNHPRCHDKEELGLGVA